MHEKRMSEFAESNPEEWRKQNSLTEVTKNLMQQMAELEGMIEDDFTGDSDGGSNVLLFDPTKRKKVIH